MDYQYCATFARVSGVLTLRERPSEFLYYYVFLSSNFVLGRRREQYIINHESS
jgi:hypothetical protein